MAGNNYTLSLAAQVSQAGLASLQAQLDNWARSYTMQLNAAVQQVQQATTQAYGVAGEQIGSSNNPQLIPQNIAPILSTNTTAVQQFNAALAKMNPTTTTYNNVAKQMTSATEASAVNLGEVSKRTIGLSSNLETFTDKTRYADVATKGLAGDIANAVEKMAMWAIAGELLFGTLRKIGDGIQYVKDLNKEMTNIAMITGATTAQTNALSISYQKLAMEVASTTLDVAKASETWLRQGKSAQDAAILTTASIQMSKLAMTDAATAAENLTAILNGFQLQAKDVNNVMDQMVALTNSTKTSAAVSFDELSAAMKNSAAIAHSAGVSLTQLASYEAVAATTTRQSGETIGNAMKTMMDRFVQVKAGATEGADSFNNVETVLRKYNMTMIDSNGNFKQLGDVIDEVGKKWNTLDAYQKNQMATAVKI